MLATIFGIVLPGAGQLYVERYGKAAAIFGGAAVATGIAIDASHNGCTGSCHGVSPVQTGGIVAAVLIWGYGWATAGSDARRRNTQMLNTTLTPFLDERNGRMLAGFSFAPR
jgi:TM2 domain-containing membrane protein YozV